MIMSTPTETLAESHMKVQERMEIIESLRKVDRDAKPKDYTYMVTNPLGLDMHPEIIKSVWSNLRPTEALCIVENGTVEFWRRPMREKRWDVINRALVKTVGPRGLYGHGKRYQNEEERTR